MDGKKNAANIADTNPQNEKENKVDNNIEKEMQAKIDKYDSDLKNSSEEIAKLKNELEQKNNVVDLFINDPELYPMAMAKLKGESLQNTQQQQQQTKEKKMPSVDDYESNEAYQNAMTEYYNEEMERRINNKIEGISKQFDDKLIQMEQQRKQSEFVTKRNNAQRDFFREINAPDDEAGYKEFMKKGLNDEDFVRGTYLTYKIDQAMKNNKLDAKDVIKALNKNALGKEQNIQSMNDLEKGVPTITQIPGNGNHVNKDDNDMFNDFLGKQLSDVENLD